MPFLSPINLLSVTPWYLKHYHSERYIAAQLHFNLSTVNYFLPSMINILYSCVYVILVILSDGMDEEDTVHRHEQHHRLIDDLIFIPIYQSEDSEERGTYYHGKCPTNYAFKLK